MRRIDRILVTGGAGFIGSHLVDRLVASGHAVRVLDSIEPQVHGDDGGYRNPEAEYVVGSVLDAEMLDAALVDVDAVVHLAAQVGVGQSMYEVARYVGENSLGTATLLDALTSRVDTVSRLVVASSMSIYGEGLYACEGCGAADATVSRRPDALEQQQWEPVCVACGGTARALPTPEWKRLECDSVYAVTKRDQEELCLVFGRAYGIPTVALRFYNVYGPRQSLSNPYTGVAAIFASRLLNGSRPIVFEDGQQSRDFVQVTDVAWAIELALGSVTAAGEAINVGTGAPRTVLDVAHALATALDVDLEPEIVGRFRSGDIRHCYADIGKARELLGYEPQVDFADGIRDLIVWIRDEQPRADDRSEQSTAELTARGLVR